MKEDGKKIDYMTMKSHIGIAQNNNGSSIIRFRNKLGTRLFFWFLILAITPLTIVSLINYNQAKNSLREDAFDKLWTTSELKTAFINNWFSYRFLDLKTQAASIENARFLSELKKVYNESGMSLSEFVKSNDWAKTVSDHEAGLRLFCNTYDYYDIYLIDEDGNILYTVAGESDIGTSLFNGPYSSTFFAGACYRSLWAEKTLFSDLELYAPSNNDVAGFLITPLIDDDSSKIGLIAFQIHSGKIDGIMQDRTGLGETGETYLIGSDFRMRSSSLHNHGEVLVTHVQTEVTEHWFQEYIAAPLLNEKNELALEQDDVMYGYAGLNGRKALGVYGQIEIGEVSWAIISEIDEYEAFSSARTLGYISFFLLAFTILIVVFLVVRISRGIVQPIERLSSIAKLATVGKYNKDIEIESADEIGELSASLDYMLKKRREAEYDLHVYADELRDAKEAEEIHTRQLSLAVEELKRSNDELDDFAYIASHDLKEPLRGIHNYSQFLLEDYEGKLDEKGVHKLNTLVALTVRMENLINSLLEFSRLGRIDLAFVETDLNEIVADVIESLKIRIAEESIDIRIPRRLPTVECDKVRIAELFRNLITNAIKYSDKDTRWIEIGFTESMTNKQAYSFYVADNGIGIRAKHIDSIFRIFKRLHGRDKFGGGTGIGLTFVKKIVDRHGGFICVDSELGVGSKFSFTITGDNNNDCSDPKEKSNAENHVDRGQSRGQRDDTPSLQEIGRL